LIKALTFRVQLESMQDLQATLDSAERAGFKLNSLDMPEPITSIEVDGNELNMGRFCADWWKRGGGQGALVINLREDVENHLSRDPNLPPDFVVVLTEDGTLMLDIKHLTKDKAEWLLENFTCGDRETAEEIKELATDSGATEVYAEGRDGRYEKDPEWKPFRSRYYNPPTTDGISVNPAPDDFKKIKKVKQTLQERYEELREAFEGPIVSEDRPK
jgi:hypothetical protein